VCVFITAGPIVQSCVRGEGGDIGGHVLRETTSRGLCEGSRAGDCLRLGFWSFYPYCISYYFWQFLIMAVGLSYQVDLAEEPGGI
jgi:hypothetical protein